MGDWLRFTLAALLVMLLASCATTQDGVTVSRSISLGIVHNCLSVGVGLAVCEQIRFDPKACAIVVIYPKAPSAGLRNVLGNLARLTVAECLKGEG